MHTQQPGTALPDYHVDPYRLLEDDLKTVYDEIRYVSQNLNNIHHMKKIPLSFYLELFNFCNSIALFIK